MNFEEFKELYEKVPVVHFLNQCNEKPLVSICVQTYQNSNHIKKCLDSILIQKTDFYFQILLGDDASTDGTKAICIEYAEKYPDKIRLFLHHRENNISISGSPTGRFNFFYNLFSANGKYVALCEGDDYWIDEDKLQKQVDFLEHNPKYGGVSTNNKWFFEKGSYFKQRIKEQGEVTFEDLSHSNLINSQTILFKKELINNLDWISDLKIGDWALHLLITSQQPYYRLPAITTVYRVHQGGVFSLLNEESKVRHKIDVLIAVLKNLELTNERKEILKSSIRNLLKKLISYQVEDVKTIREKYFEYGGKLLKKTLLKSYIHELF